MNHVYAKTNMTAIPETCAVCTFYGCTLPYKTVRGAEELRKPYFKKRHDCCPLVIIDIEERNTNGKR